MNFLLCYRVQSTFFQLKCIVMIPISNALLQKYSVLFQLKSIVHCMCNVWFAFGKVRPAAREDDPYFQPAVMIARFSATITIRTGLKSAKLSRTETLLERESNPPLVSSETGRVGCTTHLQISNNSVTGLSRPNIKELRGWLGGIG